MLAQAGNRGAGSGRRAARTHPDDPEAGMAEDQDVLVEIRGAQKTYDGQTLVIRDLDLTIRRGEFLTLLGPSGSGKTTTLLMLAGFETPTAGEILLEGRVVTHVPPYRREIGMVFQNYALFPHMTVEENVEFPLAVRKVPRARRRAAVARALEMVRLEGLERRRPGQLSGGQQQRVALARALVFAPKLVLMDEPLGALDKQLRTEMQLELKHLHANLGVTVVYVTHDQSEALTMSDRVAVFDQGRIRQLDEPMALYERPANSFVAGFVGETNTLPGVVESVRDGRCTVRVDGGARVVARPVAVDRPGERTTLSIRPERVVVDGAPLDNALEATVRELIYHGDHIRVRVSVCGTEGFSVKVPIAGGAPGLVAGATVRLGWAAADCHALDPV
jgi:putative spermidine/putrescine transport system ATP-binding protein